MNGVGRGWLAETASRPSAPMPRPSPLLAPRSSMTVDCSNDSFSKKPELWSIESSLLASPALAGAGEMQLEGRSSIKHRSPPSSDASSIDRQTVAECYLGSRAGSSSGATESVSSSFHANVQSLKSPSMKPPRPKGPKASSTEAASVLLWSERHAPRG
jgi:hypothetical protein